VPHELLLNTNRGARLVQNQTKRVPECVPAKLRDSDFCSFRPKNLPLNDARIVRATGQRGRKDKTLGLLPSQI
jgi:hypothetical protein